MQLVLGLINERRNVPSNRLLDEAESTPNLKTSRNEKVNIPAGDKSRVDVAMTEVWRRGKRGRGIDGGSVEEGTNAQRVKVNSST